jgi:RHS repeat-associated protein
VTYGTGSNTGDYLGYDSAGRNVLKIQGTGSVNYQMSASLNLIGASTAMVYPSGRTVNNAYDVAGRTSRVTGNLGDGTTRNYATELTYSSLGGMTKEKFGTTPTAVYHKLFYNVRGQLAEIYASTSYTDPTDKTWNRGAIINHYSDQCWAMCSGSNMTDNNGNLKRQDVYIPHNDQVSSSTQRWQQYDYDALNRLKWVREVVSGVEQWKQQFTYDRWGNRTIDSGVTYGAGINNKAFTVNTANNRLGVPGGQPGVMSYDATGNLKNDTYTGAGNRTYDAENKITSAWGGNNQAQLYSYDASGNRIKRTVDGVETWQVYGFGGELLAEYPANGPAANAQKEYGYRNGQLLITAESTATAPPLPTTPNIAAAAAGASATASTSYSSLGLNPANAINGTRFTGQYWNDFTQNTFPDWLQVNFTGSKRIGEVAVFSMQDNYQNPVEPTQSMTFSLYGLTAFDVQYWNGSSWVTAANVTGNNKVWRRVTFAPVSTTAIRIVVNSASDGWSRIMEVEAYERPNVAAAAAGASATASSSYSSLGLNPATAINGTRATGTFWNDFTQNTFPDWLQVTFSGSKTIGEVSVFSLQDNLQTPAEPTPDMTFALYGVTAFDVQYWNGSSWVTAASVTGNNKVWRRVTFAPVSTTAIRVVVNAASDGWSRIVELEAYEGNTNSSQTSLRWLIPDHLGTPRMTLDETGTLANMTRHDYLPFGEELFPPTGGRSAAHGYSGGDGVRQQFTQKERDVETGLDYFEARYYASTQGRFTSIDPYNIVMERQYATNAKKAESQFTSYLSNPQRWARYTYALNNPLLYTDPHGEDVTIYYRPPDEGKGSTEDQGHILIYVRNDETGEAAYFDYIADSREATVTQLNQVTQDRLDAHASLTIETDSKQEQAILNGIKEMYNSAPDFNLKGLSGEGLKQVFWDKSESTCASNSIKLLALGGINVGATPQSPTNVWTSAVFKYGKSHVEDTGAERGRVWVRKYDGLGPLRMGAEYGRDPRGQARTLDTRALGTNQTINFRGGKRLN